MSQQEPDELDFKEWLESRTTVAVFHMLRKWKQQRSEQWANGEFLHEGQFATMISNARAVGNCEIIDALLGLDFEQLVGELKE